MLVDLYFRQKMKLLRIAVKKNCMEYVLRNTYEPIAYTPSCVSRCLCQFVATLLLCNLATIHVLVEQAYQTLISFLCYSVRIRI